MATQPDHIVVVVEENHDYSAIMGSSNAPYINSLASQGALFTDYVGITHPSQPNYLAMFSGSTQGVTDNNTYTFSAPTLAGQLHNAGLTFGGYADGDAPQKHNPWESFTDSKAYAKHFADFPTDFTKLPTVSFVSPNLMHDMHDGSVRQGDDWLKANLGAYATWAKTHNSLLIVTFDEGATSGPLATANHIPTIVVGAGVTAGKYSQHADHYTLLHTIEATYGLGTLGHATDADTLHWGITDTTPVPTPTGTYNMIQGTTAADTLSGLSGSDDMVGLAGNDTLSGLDGNDRLRGSDGNDTLWAGNGADTLIGGRGLDHLYGGTDSQGDRFVFANVDQSPTGSSQDVIHNFSHGSDQIDLHGMDAHPETTGDDAFAWGGQSAAAHSVWWEATSNGIVLHADVTGDAQADFSLLLQGATDLGSADLIL